MEATFQSSRPAAGLGPWGVAADPRPSPPDTISSPLGWARCCGWRLLEACRRAALPSNPEQQTSAHQQPAKPWHKATGPQDSVQTVPPLGSPGFEGDEKCRQGLAILRDCSEQRFSNLSITCGGWGGGGEAYLVICIASTFPGDKVLPAPPAHRPAHSPDG